MNSNEIHKTELLGQAANAVVDCVPWYMHTEWADAVRRYCADKNHPAIYRKILQEAHDETD